MTVDGEAIAKLKGQYEGFTIKCDECGSEAVGIISDVGFSSISGSWGGVSLICAECGNGVEIWETS